MTVTEQPCDGLLARITRLAGFWKAHVTVWDMVILLALGAGAYFASIEGSGRLHPVIYNDSRAKNVLFDADPARVVEVMTDRSSAFHRFASTHPLFSLIAYPPVYVLRKVLRASPLEAVRVMIAAVALIWVCTLFALLRIIGCRPLDATVFTMLGMSTAAAMFWFAVPETYSFGSVTILWALAFAAISGQRQVATAWYVIVSALSLSVTVANWMVGIFATVVGNRPWKRTVQITANALVVVVLLWALEKVVFPATQFFLQPSVPGRYMLSPMAGGPVRVLTAFALNSIAMPAIDVVYYPGMYSDLPVMTIQRSLPGSGTVWGTVGVCAWGVLLALGFWSLLHAGQERRFRVVLGLAVCGQLALHTIFGWETFLYSLNFVPLLVVVGALSTLTAARWVALVLAGVVIVFVGYNNVIQFDRAARFTATRAGDAGAVGAAMDRCRDLSTASAPSGVETRGSQGWQIATRWLPAGERGLMSASGGPDLLECKPTLGKTGSTSGKGLDVAYAAPSNAGCTCP